MSDRISKLQRWLDLIACLVGRRTPVAVAQIMENVPAYAGKWVDGSETDRDSVRRMFERDKAELKEFGIPLEPVTYRINFGQEEIEGYQLARRDFYLPYLKLVRAASGGPEAASVGERPAASYDVHVSRSSVDEPDADTEQPVEPSSDPSEARELHARVPRAAEAPPRGVDRIEIHDDDARAALGALGEAASRPAFPFGREARSAFRKLAFDLDPDRLLGESPVLYVDRPGAERVAETVHVLSDALLARKRVGFRYHGIYRGRATDREVAPYGLLFQRGHWYLVGHDASREDLRVFRVGRMEDVEPNARSPKTPDYEIPDGFDLAGYANREAWELGDDAEPPLHARVIFRFPTSLWTERNGYGELVEERDDGSALRAFDVQQVDPFLRWLLTFQGEATVEHPPELADELRTMARAVVALYGGGDAEDADA